MQPLQVESLTKRYGPVTGAEDITFAVGRGEVFGYLGPNGSGKTTTIRFLMGLLRPTGGRCRILGEPVRVGRATQHQHVGYLPGDFRVWSDLSARRVLALLAALGDGPSCSSRRDELAERLGLDMDRRMTDLSKGNRQKVGVVGAFQCDADVLILDEPTIGLDPLVRQTVLELIREAAGRGAAVLLSSHDLSEVAAVCGRAAILRQGRLVELAAVAKITEQQQRRLEVWFSGPVACDALAAMPVEAHVLEQTPDTLHLAYHGSVDPIVKWLARYPVERLITPQTSLEEAFIQYYSPDAAEDAE